MRPIVSFVRTYLDVPSRLEEILFGLIMVMTVTLTAGAVVSEGQAGVRQLLFAAIGCNIAWGIIDGLMYVMGQLTTRARNAMMIAGIRRSPSGEAARAVVKAELEARLGPVVSRSLDDSAVDGIVGTVGSIEPPAIAVTGDDIRGGIACFVLVFVSCLPAALPFLVFSEPRMALRVSNALLMAMLFMAGTTWASYTGVNRLVAGLLAVALGLALVLVAIPLGG